MMPGGGGGGSSASSAAQLESYLNNQVFINKNNRIKTEASSGSNDPSSYNDNDKISVTSSIIEDNDE
jgi:hypothetical protein